MLAIYYLLKERGRKRENKGKDAKKRRKQMKIILRRVLGSSICLWAILFGVLSSLKQRKYSSQCSPGAYDKPRNVAESCYSVTKLWLTLCSPVDCSTAGSSVLQCLLEFAQVHGHWVSDAMRPSHPLLPPSLLPSAFPIVRVSSNKLALGITWPNVGALAIVLPMNIQ